MATAQAFLWGVMMWCFPSLMVLAGLISAQDIGVNEPTPAGKPD